MPLAARRRAIAAPMPFSLAVPVISATRWIWLVMLVS
jgi:hypothetical protein